LKPSPFGNGDVGFGLTSLFLILRSFELAFERYL
jgi:hypothetical protein